jgi:hypothetical protein
MREFVMYCEKGGWKITARSNYERRVRDCNKILHLSRDYVKAKHIAAYNFGLENITIIREDGTTYERSY